MSESTPARSPLELKIPPPIVGLLCGAIGWALRGLSPQLGFSARWTPAVAIPLALVGVAAAVLGVLHFRRVGTTVHPMRPSESTAVVTRGVYSLSRNPMYLGMSLVLTAWCVWLAHPLSFLAVPLFIAYITRFQIVPEERVLHAKFGEPYTEYLRSVRRWI